jgi:protein-disulfide isomerase
MRQIHGRKQNRLVGTATMFLISASIVFAGCAKTTNADVKPSATPPKTDVTQKVKDNYICPETGMSITESQQEGQTCATGDKVIELVVLMQNAGWPEEKIMSSLDIFVAGKPSKATVDVSDMKFLGKAEAPVTIIEFTDMQCPYCRRYNADTFPQIKGSYVDTGKVKYYHVNFPLPFHNNARKAAEAIYCAQDQEKFWEMRSILFTNQSAISVDNIKGYAKSLGMNSAAFDACLDGSKDAAKVDADMARTQRAGINGTPGFIIGKSSPDGKVKGKIISGAQPLTAFQAEIDKLLLPAQ